MDLPSRFFGSVGQVVATVRLSAHTEHQGLDSQNTSNEAWSVSDSGVSDVAN